jgi:hypothetical protein
LRLYLFKNSLRLLLAIIGIKTCVGFQLFCRFWDSTLLFNSLEAEFIRTISRSWIVDIRSRSSLFWVCVTVSNYLEV